MAEEINRQRVLNFFAGCYGVEVANGERAAAIVGAIVRRRLRSTAAAVSLALVVPFADCIARRHSDNSG